MFNCNIRFFFRDALRLGLKDLRLVFFLYRTLKRQKRAEGLRLSWEARGLHVPPLMIASITKRCNLKCKGCYAHAQRRSGEAEMSPGKLRSVIAEAQELGISIILLAGGEPLTRPEILEVTQDFPGIIFPLFTNGLLIDEWMAKEFKRQRNLAPVLSLESHRAETDLRQGQGIYEHLLEVMKLLHAQGVFFGSSLTVTRRNFGQVMDEAFIRELTAAGCRLFVDYVAVQPGTEELVLTEEQKQAEAQIIASFRAELLGLFVAFPGDEEIYGSCLAAGRGFVHLGPEGRLEPCPFSPFSDYSLKELSLQEALRFPFLKIIRESDGELSETQGGCALWEKREWEASLFS